MHTLVKAIICVVIFFFYTIMVNGDMSCNPAEENKNHSIRLTLPTKKEYNDIRIESMYQQIATCHHINKTCRNINSKKFSVTYTERKGYHVVTVFIYNISRKRFGKEKQWFVAFYENSIMDNKSKCNITVFAKPEDIRCINSILNDEVYVTCIAHKIYPNAICLYRMRVNNSVPVLTEMCSNEINGDPEYFTSSCTFGSHLLSLKSGIFTVNVTIYPNVTNDESDEQYGTKVFHSFSLGPPKQIHAKESHTPASLSRNLNDTVSIEINLMCFPRPKTYRLIKDNASETIFDKVKNGHAASDGYVIIFKDGETSYVTLYLNFTILKANDFTHYLLVIDNGIVPGLEYHFSIEEDIINKSSVITLVVSVVAAFTFVTGLCLCFVCCCLKRKAFFLDGNSIVPQHLYEVGNIEERQVDCIEGNNGTNVECVQYSIVNKGRMRNYDVLDRL